jgi:hypothetical protein
MDAKPETKHDADPQQGPRVTITVNNNPIEIHRGRQPVTAIKEAAHVPLAHDLEQVIDGALKPLADDAAVTLHGNEVFVSHPKDGNWS